MTTRGAISPSSRPDLTSSSRSPTASRRPTESVSTTSTRVGAPPGMCSGRVRPQSSTTPAATCSRPTSAACSTRPTRCAAVRNRLNRGWTDLNNNRIVDCDLRELCGPHGHRRRSLLCGGERLTVRRRSAHHRRRLHHDALRPHRGGYSAERARLLQCGRSEPDQRVVASVNTTGRSGSACSTRSCRACPWKRPYNRRWYRKLLC